MKTVRNAAVLIIITLLPCSFIYGQDNKDAEQEENAIETVFESPAGYFQMYLDNSLVFALGIPEGGVGFGETAVFEYVTPMGLSFALETGFYGFKSDIENGGVTTVGGFSIVPIMANVSYDFRVFRNFNLSPVAKIGIAYTNARINGWLGGTSFSPVFEGGVYLRGKITGDMVIQGNLIYTGIIEKSGLFHLMSLGFGFGYAF